MPKLDGIDISHWQSEPVLVDWDAVATTGITLLSVKATECSQRANGTINDFVDPKFAYHRAGSAKVKSLRWKFWYHWLDATVDGKRQAEHYLKTVGTLGPGEGVCLDVEEQQKGAALARYGNTAADFCGVVEAETGRPVQLYALKALWGHPRLDDGKRAWWLAWWPSNPDSASTAKRLAEFQARQKRLAGWQWDAYYQSFPGVRENVDVNAVLDPALMDLCCGLTGAPPEGPPREHPKPTLRKGARGAAVTDLQARLKRAGFRLSVDGWFGPQTEGVVRAYQRSRKLTIDGWVGNQTWTALLAEPTAP